jgi:polysaccharide export outer membrane protein
MAFIRIPVATLMALCLSAMVCGCMASGIQQLTVPSSSPKIARGDMPVTAARPIGAGPAPSATTPTIGLAPNQTAATESPENAAELESLWNSRMATGSGDPPETFTLGSGDLLLISVPFIEQLKNQTVRVSEKGKIVVPLLGVINVDGMTEDDLRGELARRVRKYMFHPQVQVFLKHTEHRHVAVLGAVKQPGRYMLSSQSETIMMMISHAGGLNGNAASRIMLIPAPAVTQDAGLRNGAQAHEGSPEADPALVRSSFHTVGAAADGIPTALLDRSRAVSAKQSDSGEVTLDLFQPQGERYREMLVRAGDIIIVPAAGEVTVQGWVDKPGAYSITPGLTVLGAIAAAGGANFTSSATLLRESDAGKLQIRLDLSKIKHGQATDVAVQSGDVVVVNHSAIGAVPYAFYEIFSKFGAGMYLPVP